MKKRNLLILLALILCAALTGCGRNAKPSENAGLSGGASEFSDIAGHPAEEAILEGLRLDLYDVPSDGLFRPDEPVTGGDFLAALWNLDKGASPDSASDRESQVRDAIAWADENGLADAASFDSGAPVTRQDAVSVLYAYNGGVGGLETMLTGVYDDAFEDSDQIPDEGKPALYWGFYNVLIKETEPDIIAPSGTVSRGDMAVMMVRYAKDFKSEPPEN